MIKGLIQFACLLLITILWSGRAAAVPDLQNVQVLNGVTLFADHADNQLYYYLKSEKQIATRDSAPDFSYHVNRYIGKKQTGDADEFWVRGVIKFSAVSEFRNTDYQSLIDALSLQQGRKIKLESAPVKDEYNRLVYALIAQGEDDEFSGELESGRQSSELDSDTAGEHDVARRYGSLRQRFTIGVSGNDANLFWDNFARDNLSLSLAYGWTVSGMIKNEADEWVTSTYQINNTIPIDVSSKQYPQLFHKNELWQRLSFAHSTLKVMCYDFINLDESDLYYVTVDIRFETFNSRYYKEQVRFLADSDHYEVDVSFELANDIKQGFEYRVSRLTNEGKRTTGDWIRSKDAWIDVSLSSAELADFEKNGEQL